MLGEHNSTFGIFNQIECFWIDENGQIWTYLLLIHYILYYIGHNSLQFITGTYKN